MKEKILVLVLIIFAIFVSNFYFFNKSTLFQGPKRGKEVEIIEKLKSQLLDLKNEKNLLEKAKNQLEKQYSASSEFGEECKKGQEKVQVRRKGREGRGGKRIAKKNDKIPCVLKRAK